ncbi:MAG: response regulator [Actinomycetia bacterium]|nr:response regulator [Actinomycetes bacterium]
MEEVLIVDDDENILKLLSFRFSKEGYSTRTALNGNTCLDLIRIKIPNLVILDVSMPVMDGFEALRNIRANLRTSHLPVIMLTARSDLSQRIVGLKMGADDYIPKPFNIEELILKSKNLIRRAFQESLTNPLTGLPGNETIKSYIENLLQGKDKKWAIFYIDLDNFKTYNDYYGFSKGDEAILSTRDIIKEVVLNYGNNSDFLGHIGGDDFILISSPDKIDALSENIINFFDKKSKALYKKEDLDRGFILIEDRKGKLQKQSFLSISIGIVTGENDGIENYFKMGEVLSGAKNMAKKIEGSSYFIERRNFDFPQE